MDPDQEQQNQQHDANDQPVMTAGDHRHLQRPVFGQHVQVMPQYDAQHPAEDGKDLVEVAAGELGEGADAAPVVEHRGEAEQQPATNQ
ncbi:hypothetical protein D3C84_771230 [compost metagenome]